MEAGFVRFPAIARAVGLPRRRNAATLILSMSLQLHPVFFDNTDAAVHSRPIAYTVFGLLERTAVSITVHPSTRDRWIMHRSFEGGPYTRVGAFGTPEEAIGYLERWQAVVREEKVRLQEREGRASDPVGDPDVPEKSEGPSARSNSDTCDAAALRPGVIPLLTILWTGALTAAIYLLA